MKVANLNPLRPNMGETKTYEDFAKFLGKGPHRLGILSRMYPDLTATYLTESLMNIYVNQESASKFQSIDAFAFEWEIDVDFIKRVEFAAQPEGDGAGGTDIKMAFKERYYEKYDTFRIEGSRQTCIVLHAPRRVSDAYWEVIVRLIDTNNQTILDADACHVGATTRFLTNYHPELSEEGYTKFQSNIERHRNHISTHRNDITFSAQFAMLEDVFMDLAYNKGQGKQTETVFKMKKKEKELLENFLYARNNALLFGKTNVDANGKANITDPHTGRPIYIGDGIIAQIERYANKYAYSRFSINAFYKIMDHMRQKSRTSQGNQYVFTVNEPLYSQIQHVLRDYLKDWKTDGTFFYSKSAGKNVKVGATFDTIEFAGNQITFQVDKALTLEYPDKGYGLIIDLTADRASNSPAMQMFTLHRGEFIRNVIKGVGGTGGNESGDVASRIAGTTIVHMGYAGVGVFNPYRSYIIEQQ